MKFFIVTVKLPRNPDHNPRSKVTGKCPTNGIDCTDVTGEHHSFLVSAEDDVIHVEEIRDFYTQNYHVTRVEEVLLVRDIQEDGYRFS
jgi:hypothetical protein